MFADPLAITVNAVQKNLIRIKHDGYSSEYLLRTSTEEFRLNIRNTSYIDKRKVPIDRHNAELVHTVFPVSPGGLSIVRKSYAVIENQQGDTLNDPMYVGQALAGFLTGTNITKLLNQES